MTGSALVDDILSQPGGGISAPGRAQFDAVLAATEELRQTPGQGRLIEAVLKAYETAPGARPGTGYGLVQAVTYYETHERGRSGEDRYVRRLGAAKQDSELLDLVLEELKIPRAA